jgi:hypothetical protein
MDNVVSTLWNCLDPLVPIFSNHQKKDLHTFRASHLPIFCVSCGHNTFVPNIMWAQHSRAKHYVGTFYPLGSPKTKMWLGTQIGPLHLLLLVWWGRDYGGLGNLWTRCACNKHKCSRFDKGSRGQDQGAPFLWCCHVTSCMAMFNKPLYLVPNERGNLDSISSQHTSIFFCHKALGEIS